MKKKLLLVSVIVLTLISTGCGKKTPKLQNGEEVIASIEGKSFTTEELYTELKKEGGYAILIDMIDKYITEKEISDSDSITTYVNNQYEQAKAYYETYLQQDFESLLTSSGFENSDAYKAYIKSQYKKQLLIESYVKDAVSKDEINDYYEKNVFAPITVKYILVEVEKKEDMSDDELKEAKSKALEKANKILDEIKNGEKTFEEALNEYSKDTSDSIVIEYTSDIDAAFLSEAKKLSVGKYSTSPVESKYGYNIILKEKVDEKPSVEDVKENIIDTIADDKLSADTDNTLFNQTLVKIRKKYNLEIVDTDINSSYKKSIKDFE